MDVTGLAADYTGPKKYIRDILGTETLQNKTHRGKNKPKKKKNKTTKKIKLWGHFK